MNQKIYVFEMSSAELRKISETGKPVEISECGFVCFPQLKLWVNSINTMPLTHSFNCGNQCNQNTFPTTLVV